MTSPSEPLGGEVRIRANDRSGLVRYVPGESPADVAREAGLSPAAVAKLSSNENPYGPSPQVLAALREAAGDPEVLLRYPDGASRSLRAALARRHGVDPSWIFVGAGLEDVLQTIAARFLEPGAAAVMSRPSFAMYPILTRLFGAEAVEVPVREGRHDLAALAESVRRREDVRLVWLDVPDNPLGTAVDPAAVESFVAELPPDVLLVYDEAYAEYVAPGAAPSGVELARRQPNVLALRTFSKAYGLAGLRVGYAVGRPELVEFLEEARRPFNLSALAQRAAEAALEDEEHVFRVVRRTRAARERLAGELRELGYPVLPSETNFVFVPWATEEARRLLASSDCPAGSLPGEAGEISIGEAHARLKRAGVIVRPFPPLGLRISVGTEDDIDRAVAAFRALRERYAAGWHPDELSR
ncbi:MAG: Biosynthetic Aromatic amino acid aminotransferase beta [Brockia lithotrophica]|uniref:Histidinol-phosphate aminotransferase n=1 Tax=Brockia lithotrophica TaxID=933949 RepID=A0A2T5G743_9BACL|nr:MAG: Biosynthetic Aromatic amino acid aminotransferase beta [Brockia lithotrophica]